MRNKRHFSAVTAALVMLMIFMTLMTAYAGTGSIENIANSNIVKSLQNSVQAGDITAADISGKVETYLRSIGLSDTDIDRIKTILYTAVAQAAANASKTAAAPDTSETALEQDIASEKSEAEEARIYVVKSGDTLQRIAKREYGDSKKWKDIYELNKDTIKNPNRIDIGQKIKIA
ncbi:hypothetical protein BXO88_06700 [Oribacterium sp. C9]|uniref:LysM peptidoglycan-binding domain-containing protein n=1 Tax=Oribacterium sp. C9 TaxID=1943579 RepID=UPI00098FDC9D|nr:LysM peptidoglycan-binding domain-containing protein [Oribacterium sp. C9]OON86676.1 hypothetical protein BXO88_06700 [Oribacterium sp. C9]